MTSLPSNTGIKQLEICAICNKEFIYFGKKKRVTCSKECSREYERNRTRIWREQNQDYNIKYMRVWRAKNRERVRQLSRDFRQKNASMMRIREKINSATLRILKARHLDEYKEVRSALIEKAKSKHKVFNREPTYA